MNFKIRTSIEEFIETQEILFSLGFKWAGGSTEINSPIQLPLYIFFYTQDGFPLGNPHNCKDITWGTEIENFNRHTNEEITFEQLKSEEFQEKLKKALLIGSLK